MHDEQVFPTYLLSNGRLFVPALGIELEPTNQGDLLVYEGGQIRNELVKTEVEFV